MSSAAQHSSGIVRDNAITAAQQERLDLFHSQLTRALSQNPPSPVALIRVGAFDPARLAEIQRRLPTGALTLWVHPELPPMTGDSSGNFRVLHCAISDVVMPGLVAAFVAMQPGREIHLSADARVENDCTAAVNNIRRIVGAVLSNRRNEATRGLIRLRSSICNLPSIFRNSGLRIRRLEPGQSAIVCGAGPSLASQLPQLKESKGRACIIAVGHAVLPLARAGIVPDVVVEADSQAAGHWPEDLAPGSLLVAQTEVAPEVAARFDEVFWCAGCSSAFNALATQWGVRVNEVAINSTVSVLAVDFARRCGFEHIALVGMDFCISRAGRLYADGSVSDNADPVISIPGLHGPVSSTAGLVMLRDAFEEYLRASAGTGGVVYNCSEGGALILGPQIATLAEFCGGLPEERREFRCAEVDQRDVPSGLGLIEAAESELSKYAECARRIEECCLSLCRMMEAQPPDLAAIGLAKSNLERLFKEEGIQRSKASVATAIDYALRFVDAILAETPGASNESASAQLKLLAGRFGFASGLVSDIRSSMAHALCVARRETPNTSLSPRKFQSFRGQALRRIATDNPSSAEFLQGYEGTPLEERFQVRWLNQFLPYVALKMPDQKLRALCGLHSMAEQARADVNLFVERTGFQATDSVTFVAPGQWAHVIEFASRFPSARIAVLEPWPELLTAMSERGLFLHRLPPGTLIAVADDTLPDWRGMYRAWQRKCAEEGIACHVFPHPKAAAHPDVEELARFASETAVSAGFE